MIKSFTNNLIISAYPTNVKTFCRFFIRHKGLVIGIIVSTRDTKHQYFTNSKPSQQQKEVKSLPTFIREKRIDCGKQYQEVDIFPMTESAESHRRRKGKRNKKQKESEPKQKNLNDKNSKRYFIQLANLNFASDPKGLHVTVTYSDEFLPQTLKEAEKEVTNYLRRIKSARKKAGLPLLKYILVTEHSGADDDHPVRVHHHIIMNGGLERDDVENLWRKPRKKGEKQGQKIGYANADRLQANEEGIAALCVYLSKHPNRKKRWTSSHNLERPVSSRNDTKYTKKQVEKWAKEPPTKEFWEKKYKGWTPTSEEYGVTFEFNDVTAEWSIYLKLRKKE